MSDTPEFEPLPATAEGLVTEYRRIDAHVRKQNEAFADFIAPYSGRMAEIKNKLLALSIDLKVNSFKTDAGTAYKSTLLNPTVDDTDSLLDQALENWETWGRGMLKIGITTEAVKAFMEAHEGRLPPGVKINPMVRMNVRL